MPIRVLPKELVSKIAAGEVVERPASVVKELLENSLDAGATEISVEMVGGGLRLIRVLDNGTGMPADEVETAFRSHATSKLCSLDELDRISSLGFRGEALPSIAAVAEVTVLTRCASESSGTFLSLKDGLVVERSHRACQVGSTITVRQLFATVPARLKFLRSAASESSHVAHLVGEYSLAYPEIRFELTIDGRSALRTSGSGDRREAVARVYGADVARAMLDLSDAASGEHVDDRPITIVGLVSPPTQNRVGRQYISVFANRRPVQSRAVLRAVEDAYGGSLGPGRKPIAIVDITVSTEAIDVNVHPAKREVRFQREREVYAAVFRATRRALEGSSPVAILGGAPAAQHPGPTLTLLTLGWRAEDGAEAGTSDSEGGVPISSRDSTPEASGILPILRVIGQVGGTYIIAEGPDGMYLIDQHTAHERILYEKLVASAEERGVDVQGLLDPVVLELSAPQMAKLREAEDSFSKMGFHIEVFGESSCLLRAVPAVLKGNDPRDALLSIVDSLLSEGSPGDCRNDLCLTVACHSAVRAGQVLRHEEMRQLVRDLEKTKHPHSCPHGRPILVLLSAAQLEREFGRR